MELFVNDKHLLADFFTFFCGKLLGEGRDRNVYEFKYNSELVVKIDKGDSFANVAEWHIWNNVSRYNQDVAKFFAPCIQISSCGKVMLQQRTKPIENELPALIPSFIWDIKKENWGLIEGKPVCHDYANHIMSKKVNSKLVKPKWYE